MRGPAAPHEHQARLDAAQRGTILRLDPAAHLVARRAEVKRGVSFRHCHLEGALESAIHSSQGNRRRRLVDNDDRHSHALFLSVGKAGFD
jgi:hypothetical protein